MIFLSLLIILLIVLAAGAWFLAPDRVDETSPALLRGLAEIRQQIEQKEETTTTTVYKWRDEAGEWHFSNRPPAPDTAVEVHTYRSDSNIVPAPQAPSPPPTARAPASENSLPIPGLPAPTTVEKVLDDARQVQKTHRDRQQNIDQQIDAAQ